MLIPSVRDDARGETSSLSRRVNANSQLVDSMDEFDIKLIKKGEC